VGDEESERRLRTCGWMEEWIGGWMPENRSGAEGKREGERPEQKSEGERVIRNRATESGTE
jgi:hypothetical protein